MTDPDCLFCRIASGNLPAKIVHENDRFVAFRDIDPRAETHVLVMPRSHTEHLDSFVDDGGDTAGMMLFIRDVAGKLGVAGRYRLIANVGKGAGQEVPHLHWHILAGSSLPGFGEVNGHS